MNDVNILVVGVGGQGVILASDAIGEIGMKHGYDVKKSDSIGMSQRGGSVLSHVRWGKRVFSPMIKKGEVDYLLGFEQLEAARWAAYLKPNGVAIVSDVAIVPVSAFNNNIPYPTWEEVREILTQQTKQIFRIPATQIGREIGNEKALNVVMLGSLSEFLELEPQAWTEDIRPRLPAKFVKSSLEAFSRGATEARTLRARN